MFLNHKTNLKYTKYIFCYTLFLSQIPPSNSLRIGMISSKLTYIGSYNSFKSNDNGNRLYDNTPKHKFRLKSSKVDEIFESLKNLTLVEGSELVKKIEDEFGISRAALQQPLALAPQATKPQEAFKDEEEEDVEQMKLQKKRQHSVIIKQINKDQLYPAYKALKQYYTNISALEVKKIMDSLPYTVKTVSSRREAEEIVKKLTAEGMLVEIE